MELEEQLREASGEGNIEGVKKLLQLGAHVDGTDEDGSSSLMLACRYVHAEVVRILVSAGSHVNDQDKHGTSSLMEACRNGHAEVVRILVSAGAHVNDQDKMVVCLPMWSVLDRLKKKWMPSPDQLMSRLVVSILGSKLWSKFADPQETKEPKRKGCPEHQTIVFFRGLSVAVTTLVPKGVVQEGDCCHIHLYDPGVHGLAEVCCKQCNSFFRARDWDQLEGVAETLVASDTSGVDNCGRWGQGSGQYQLETVVQVSGIRVAADILACSPGLLQLLEQTLNQHIFFRLVKDASGVDEQLAAVKAMVGSGN
eukprot:Em0001g1266a